MAKSRKLLIFSRCLEFLGHLVARQPFMSCLSLKLRFRAFQQDQICLFALNIAYLMKITCKREHVFFKGQWPPYWIYASQSALSVTIS